MKTDTVNTEKLEVSNNLDKEGEKYVPAYFVYAKKIRCECSILPPGYGFTEAEQLESRDNAKYNAELIATAVNACKEINPDNPLNVAKAIPELFKALMRIAEGANSDLPLNASDARGFTKIASAAIKQATE